MSKPKKKTRGTTWPFGVIRVEARMKRQQNKLTPVVAGHEYTTISFSSNHKFLFAEISMQEKSFNAKDLMFLPEDEYLKKANENINRMVRLQIQRNIDRHALNSLVMILALERDGKDSYSIVEDLKTFFANLACTCEEDNPRRREMVQQMLEDSRLRNEEKAKPRM